MSHNPLARELDESTAELTRLRTFRSQLDSDLSWFSRFDRRGAEEERAGLVRRCGESEERLSATREEIAIAKRKTSQLRAETDAGWDPRYWFSKDRSRAKDRLGAHVRHITDLITRQKDLEKDLDQSRSELENVSRSIATYEEFDQASAAAELAALDAELPIRQGELDKLAARKERLDERLRGAVEGLEELTAELEGATSRRKLLRSEAVRVERQVEQAEDLDRQLSLAVDGRERWEVHQECEDEFGDSSPRRVLGSLRRELNEARREISDLNRRIPAMQRDVDKAKQRVAVIVTRGTRNIQSIVIDGNNLCYQDGRFIGFAALRPLCRRLQDEYEVTIVFDASIKRLLSGSPDKRHWIPEERMRDEFPGTRLHIVAARTQADETILAAAVESVVYVLSNDRFSEYRDKPAVREKRLLSHEILGGRVLVHDLDISIPFAPRL